MPTTVTKSIGTSSRDYSTIQAWEDACPANLVTADQVWKGECYNDSEFGGIGAQVVTIAGETTDSTRYLWLTAAAGQSFVDNASATTNALAYSQSNGVGIRCIANYGLLIDCQVANTVVERLQWYWDSTYTTYPMSWSGAGISVRNCVFQSRANNMGNFGTGKFTNCLFLQKGASGNGPDIAGSAVEFHNCTIVAVSSTGTGIRPVYGNYPKVLNTAVFGFSTAFGSSLGGYPSGTTNNASDANLAGMTGSGHVSSLTYSSQFQNISSGTEDYRAKSGGGLAAGTPDATFTSGLDIVGQTRSGTTPYIGAWEIVSAGGGASFIPPAFLTRDPLNTLLRR